jgi:hypothetical protein
MTMTTKKQLDKFLTRLFALQRECFKHGSKSSLEVRPIWSKDFSIYVVAYNENINNPYVKEDGTKGLCHLRCFYIYSFDSVEGNEKVMKKIKDFLTYQN